MKRRAKQFKSSDKTPSLPPCGMNRIRSLRVAEGSVARIATLCRKRGNLQNEYNHNNNGY